MNFSLYRCINFFCSILLCACALFASAARAETVTYNYDAAGRLTAASYASGTNLTYAYNLAGDLLNFTVVTGAVFTDTDGDGMDDNWEIQYFGNLARNGLGDFDGDGVSDKSEYLAGTSPANATSFLRVTQLVVSGQTNAVVQWSSVTNKNYRVQFKNALTATSWTDLSGDISATTTNATKTDPGITGFPSRFYRVLVLP
jgi:YD repeat-containing protein